MKCPISFKCRWNHQLAHAVAAELGVTRRFNRFDLGTWLFHFLPSGQIMDFVVISPKRINGNQS
jgi:hypothetical protein